MGLSLIFSLIILFGCIIAETVEDRIAEIVKDTEEEEVTWAGQFKR